MPNYQNTIIYKIYSKDANITETYIGSTTNFIKRRYAHKSTCYNEKSKLYNLKVYSYIRDNGGWCSWDMIEIEKYPCNNIKEAKLRESYWIKELKSSLNSCIPSRTKKEYYENNKEYLDKKHKHYYENNKQIILEKQKQYSEDNKQKIAKRCKKYRENNKQIILEKGKVWYENNKNKINEKRKEIIKCECGCKVTKGNLSTHLKTTKHQLLMNFKNEPFNNYDE